MLHFAVQAMTLKGRTLQTHTKTIPTAYQKHTKKHAKTTEWDEWCIADESERGECSPMLASGFAAPAMEEMIGMTYKVYRGAILEYLTSEIQEDIWPTLAILLVAVSLTKAKSRAHALVVKAPAVATSFFTNLGPSNQLFYEFRP